MRGKQVALMLMHCGLGACSHSVATTDVPMPASSNKTEAPLLTEAEPARPWPCPKARPVENTACDHSTHGCEYGESPDVQCTERMTCRAGVWGTETRPVCVLHRCPDRARLVELEGSPCELPLADGATAPAADAELQCPVAGGTCACTTGAFRGVPDGRRWLCLAANTQPGCPAERPHQGQSCEGPGVTCDYGACLWKGGVTMECFANVWRVRGGGCP